MLFDRQRQFQIQFDFEGLASEVHRERQNVYVERPGFEILQTAQIPTTINSSKHVYKSRGEHASRIQSEKVAERHRREQVILGDKDRKIKEHKEK